VLADRKEVFFPDKWSHTVRNVTLVISHAVLTYISCDNSLIFFINYSRGYLFLYLGMSLRRSVINVVLSSCSSF
jgi:hypothetical protein